MRITWGSNCRHLNSAGRDLITSPPYQYWLRRSCNTAPRSPWQRAYVERDIGTIRRECLDHVIGLPCRGFSEVQEKTDTCLWRRGLHPCRKPSEDVRSPVWLGGFEREIPRIVTPATGRKKFRECLPRRSLAPFAPRRTVKFRATI
jgi:transposase InsO family protein